MKDISFCKALVGQTPVTVELAQGMFYGDPSAMVCATIDHPEMGTIEIVWVKMSDLDKIEEEIPGEA